MTHVLLLSMWATAISAWYSLIYFYRCGSTGKPPDMGVMLKSAAVTGISLFIGCVVYSFLQAAVLNGGLRW